MDEKGKDANTAKGLADALLTEWSECTFADDHGKSNGCGREDCTFTSDLFSTAILFSTPGARDQRSVADQLQDALRLCTTYGLYDAADLIAGKKEKPTHFVHCNSGNALFVKTAEYFEQQGGLTQPWGQVWKPVVAASIGDARRQAAEIFGVPLSPIHADEE